MHGRIPPIVIMDGIDSPSLERRLASLRERVGAAARRSGRSPDAVELLAVTKRQSRESVAKAREAGIELLGESYIAEAEAKREAFRGASCHLIGALQRNKAGRAVALFDVIESVDRLALAQILGRKASELGKTQRVLVEVNLSAAPQRTGTTAEEALALCEQVATIDGVALEGLMGIAPLGGESEARRAFAALRELFERLPNAYRQVLSMGMSQDFEVAIEEGATRVRIGTALFGEYRHPTG
jgi:hypothetical protein